MQVKKVGPKVSVIERLHCSGTQHIIIAYLKVRVVVQLSTCGINKVAHGGSVNVRVWAHEQFH